MYICICIYISRDCFYFNAAIIYTYLQLYSNFYNEFVHGLPQSYCGDNQEGTLFS